MVEQRTENPCVVSPILTRGTKAKKNKIKLIITALTGFNFYNGVWPSWSKASGLGPEDREFESLHPDKRKKRTIIVRFFVSN